jgi:hypothetical protein
VAENELFQILGFGLLGEKGPKTTKEGGKKMIKEHMIPEDYYCSQYIFETEKKCSRDLLLSMDGDTLEYMIDCRNKMDIDCDPESPEHVEGQDFLMATMLIMQMEGVDGMKASDEEISVALDILTAAVVSLFLVKKNAAKIKKKGGRNALAGDMVFEALACD